MTPADNSHEAMNELLRTGMENEGDRADGTFGCPLPIRHVIGAACLLYMALGSVESLFASGF